MRTPKVVATLTLATLPLLFAATLPLAAQTKAANLKADAVSVLVDRIASSPAFKIAEAKLAADFDTYVQQIITITEIPAPPFKEEARGKAFADMLRAAGLTNIMTDEVGNVIALRPGTDKKAKPVVISAHLDTVFPEGTPIKVVREGNRLHAPGIGDDSRGLANLLAYARALDAAKIKTKAPILFVGTVGEEGQGDLRGVRHLFTQGAYKDRIGAFFSIDGSDPAGVTNGGVGSKRYRVTFSGPGGHSFGAFGIVNPMNAMASAINGLYQVKTPATPKTTYSASVTGGGTSVNSIPNEVWLEVDMRSVDATELAKLDQQFTAIVAKAVADENAARSTQPGSIKADMKVIGERPAGTTLDSATIVRAVSAAATAKGFSPKLGASSTDSNIAMSLGIPAVTIGSGGSGERAHALDEYIDVEREESLRGMSVGLLALLATAGVAK